MGNVQHITRFFDKNGKTVSTSCGRGM